jgi:predicted transcriptional regulator YdeE
MIAKTEITDQNQFFIAGISVRTTNRDGQSAKDIGGLWTRFINENLAQQITGRLSDDTYCVYFDYETDDTGPYTAIFGCKVESLDNIPAGFTGATVPAGNYKAYYLSGEFPATIGAAWKEIWASGIKRKYTADYDFYKADPKSFEETEARIYLAVK